MGRETASDSSLILLAGAPAISRANHQVRNFPCMALEAAIDDCQAARIIVTARKINVAITPHKINCSAIASART